MNKLSIFIISAILINTSFLSAEEIAFHITPYLQTPKSDGMKIRWEAPINVNYIVKYGAKNSDLNNSATPTLIHNRSILIRRKLGVYEASLEGLIPKTRYYFQISSDQKRSQIYSFKTLKRKQGSFAFIVASDAQKGHQATDTIIKESIMYHAFAGYSQKEEFPISFSLFPGDLVQKGFFHYQWKKHFFKPMSPLVSKIPIIPAIGNHEMGSANFRYYFDIPNNGGHEKRSRWHYFDYQSVRFITLDTSFWQRKKEQLRWLESVLNITKSDSAIQFVILQFHHPFRSETWQKGETDYSGDIEDILVKFGSSSNKPIIYFNGHTHAYSRGHHLDAPLTMITVGPIGGNLDKWTKTNKDYIEFHKTIPQYGWAMVQVDNTQTLPKVTVKRFGFGDEDEFKDTGIIDQFTIDAAAMAPAPPQINKIEAIKKREIAVSTNTYKLHLSPIDQSNEEHHLSTQIHIESSKRDGKKISNKVIQINDQNIFRGEDQNIGIDLSKPEIKIVIRKGWNYSVKVRYRNQSLKWSEWSQSRPLNQ